MLGRLETAFTEMRQFTADASHELQTPLTILRGEMEVALRSTRSPDEYGEVLKSALEEIREDIAPRGGAPSAGPVGRGRAQDGPGARRPRALSPKKCLSGSVPMRQSKGVALKVGRIEPVMVAGDRVHLERLLFNLVDNAIKYTPAEGTVAVEIAQDGGFAVLGVADTGIGIPAEEQQNVFQRFYRSADARSQPQGGSGLGLSIVQSIAEAHGGRVELESAAGQGEHL